MFAFFAYFKRTRSGNENVRGLMKISVFATFVLLLTVVLHLSINAGLRRISTSSFGVWNRIIDGRVNAGVVISGSSRAMSHYDPQPISKALGINAYNIGLNGSQTDMQVAWLKTYLDHNAKPALVIHNLDIFSFQVTHGGVYDPAQYVPYLGEETLYKTLRKIYPPVWKSKFVPLYGYTVEDLRFTWVLGLRALFGWNPVEDHFSGYKPKDTAWTEDFDKLRADHPDGVTFEIEPDGVRAMEELLKHCREQGVKVILVYSPEYSEMQKMTKERLATFRAFENLAQRFGAVIWDYSSSSISEDRRNFYNSQHLNRVGAAQFSQDLARRLASDPVYGRLAESFQGINLSTGPDQASSPR